MTDEQFDAVVTAHGSMSFAVKKLNEEAEQFGWSETGLELVATIKRDQQIIHDMLIGLAIERGRMPPDTSVNTLGEHRPRPLVLDER